VSALRTWFGSTSPDRAERIAVMDADPRYADTHYLVEATDTERHAQWCFASTESPFRYDRKDIRDVEWIQTSPGAFLEIARQKGRPVCVCLQWDYLNGALVCFWEPTSRLVDYDLIDPWLKMKFPNIHTTSNAMNIHNVILEIGRRAKK
jgi:hypothetical protein